MIQTYKIVPQLFSIFFGFYEIFEKNLKFGQKLRKSGYSLGILTTRAISKKSKRNLMKNLRDFSLYCLFVKS